MIRLQRTRAHPRVITLLVRLAVLGLLPAVAAPQSGRISVAQNVRVSTERSKFDHGEAVICASLTDPNLLIAASASATHEKLIYSYGETSGEIVYYSRDGGKSWRYAFDTFDKGGISPDAACAYGPDGSAHFSTMLADSLIPNFMDLDLRLLDYRSPDGGLTWEKPVKLPGASGADRQFMIFDNTQSKYRGRYYMSFDGSFNQHLVNGDQAPKQLFGLSRSLDGGKTWELPATRGTAYFHNGNLAVLSDGTVLGVIGMGLDRTPPAGSTPSGPNAEVWLVPSSDGGEFVGKGIRVSDMYTSKSQGVHMINSVAVDASAAYKDRIYVAWNDDRSGRTRVVLSYSADKGVTWTTPRPIDDSKPFDEKDLTKGPQVTAPWLAVNKDGVLGAVWLDRRDVKDNIGYHVRFSASLDGGETWLPSVRVSEVPMSPRTLTAVAPYGFTDHPKSDTISAQIGWEHWDFTGGDATSIDADAAGRFHPAWVDARTGTRQIWTSTIDVSGQVVPQRILAPSTSVAVTPSIAFEFVAGSLVYDSAKRVVTVDVRLRNSGKDTVRAPVIVRVTQLGTYVAEGIHVVNTENGRQTVGAEWDFSAQLANGALNPGEYTKPKRLVFQLDGADKYHVGEMSGGGLLNIKLVVLGHPNPSR